mgnify:CR=1 FL=1
MSNEQLKKNINLSINKFIDWFEAFGESSYDRMDYWSSRTGILAKKIFYFNKILGIPLAAWGLLLENFLPKVQKIYSKKHREVIGDAHFALSYFNLYEVTKEKRFLNKAEHFLSIMEKTSTKGYSGMAWGYTFGWQQSKGKFWKSGIPMITITPYAFWAFKKHFEITNCNHSKEVCLSIADFALNDLKKTVMSNGTTSYSYSPISKDVIINANTYRAAMLLDAYKISNNEGYRISAEESIEFVLSYQGQDGEWPYEVSDKNDSFIDNFHTCFVLRNLYKCYLVNKDQKLLNAIVKGYEYYYKNLFHDNGRPKHFSKIKYAKMRKYEMYDYAEGITLGILLKNHVSKSLEKSIFLANDLIDNFQTDKGYFITRITSLNTKHKVPYLRWPQAQLLFSLTNLYKDLK